MPVFPVLPVLRKLRSRVQAIDLSDVVIIGVQHLLESTGSLVEELVELGVRPENVLLTGKSYSTNAGVTQAMRKLGVYVQSPSLSATPGRFEAVIRNDVDELWSRAIQRFGSASRRIVVLDDGGRCLRAVPPRVRQRYNLTGVEQTTSGVSLQVAGQAVGGKMVAVALCAAKRLLEAPFVARAILERSRPYLAEAGNRPVCGIVGLGWIGRALAEVLVQNGFRVFAFDSQIRPSALPNAVRLCRTVSEVVEHAKIIFGCTGTSVFQSTPGLERVAGDRWFLSCSSEDVEFRELLLAARDLGLSHEESSGAFDDLRFKLGEMNCVVAAGGYPINFDRSPESVPTRAIQITRGLLFAGVLQAAECINHGDERAEITKLSPTAQRFLVSAWLDSYPEAKSIVPRRSYTRFKELGWIERHSGGNTLECQRLDQLVEF